MLYTGGIFKIVRSRFTTSITQEEYVNYRPVLHHANLVKNLCFVCWGASPLHMVPRPDGSWCPCSNYLRLNNVTKPDCYPLPNIRDFTNNLKHCTVFSKLDLVKGYQQVPMNSEDICKTAIVTPFGLFEFLSMPFGLKNTAQTFQRLMDWIFKGLPFVFIYLDDILVASMVEVFT